MELEAVADPDERGTYPVAVVSDAGVLCLDPREAVLRAARDAAAGRSPATISARFHTGLADATAAALAGVGAAGRLGTVVLGGGVFQNRRLTAAVDERARAAGLCVLVPVRLPPNDGGVSFGQAAVAAWRDARGRGA